jgi:Concanavalin A-like lectin/glucanases superfamily
MDPYSNTGSGSTFNQFNTNSSNKYVSATQDFLDSNSLVAKVAFILLVFFLFIVLLRVGISILGYFFTPASSPKLIEGTVDATQLIVIPQDPSMEGAKTITRSVNATDGLEFTWSVWINIDNLTYNSGKYRCVFYKGNDYMPEVTTDPSTGLPTGDSENVGLNFPNNAPGVYIAPNTNDLVIIMNTFNVINEEIIVNDIPLNKWFNLIIRCQNNTLDIYINGTITKSHNLHGVPKQNYGDVYVAPNGGFDGYISNLWYYNYALGTSAISKLATRGPNTNMTGSNNINLKTANYLSLRWFFFGAQDDFQSDPPV